jgi:uncharacterized protein YndB with AHSA1/START domain
MRRRRNDDRTRSRSRGGAVDYGALEPSQGLPSVHGSNDRFLAAFDPDFATDVEVTFAETEPGRTTVDLRHRHLERYGDHADQMRALFDSPGGWSDTLDRCVRLAESE